ncbi:MAG: hypothetical protein ACR2MA_04905 [Egibacteraceae bacterium]
MRHPSLRRALAAVLLVLALIGCGADDGGGVREIDGGSEGSGSGSGSGSGVESPQETSS